MKRSIRIVLFALLVGILSQAVFAQHQNPGIANILCQLGVNGTGAYGFGNSDDQLFVLDQGANPVTHIGLASVTKLVGHSVSIVFPYLDNDHNGQVNCGDDVVQ